MNNGLHARYQGMKSQQCDLVFDEKQHPVGVAGADVRFDGLRTGASKNNRCATKAVTTSITPVSADVASVSKCISAPMHTVSPQ
jgi:hypothetical protein